MKLIKRFSVGLIIFLGLSIFASYIYFNLLPPFQPPLNYLEFALLMAFVLIILPVDALLRRMK